MGNLSAMRDWGHARDYVKAQWLMLQQQVPEDFVIATGVQYSVRQFIHWSAEELGISLRFEGEGMSEVAIVESVSGESSLWVKPGDVIVRIDANYFRPTEVETLLGDSSKAKEKLGWAPVTSAHQMCAEMVAVDLRAARQNALLLNHGYEPNRA